MALLGRCRRWRRSTSGNQFSSWVEHGITDLLPGGIILVENLVYYGVIFRQMGLLLQPAGPIILIYALEEELFVRSKENTAHEPARITDLIDDLAARFSVRISCGRDCFMLGIVELINGARTIGVQADGHANGVSWTRRGNLGDDRQSPRETAGGDNN